MKSVKICWNRSLKQASWESRETWRRSNHNKTRQGNSLHKKEGHHICTLLSRQAFQAIKFIQTVSKLKIHKSAIIFKINCFKLIEKHPQLKKSSVTLTFLKNYFKDIKEICEENSSDFEWVKVICLQKLF